MRTRAMTVEHQQAATRRLARLSAQLQAERDGARPGTRVGAEVLDPDPWEADSEPGRGPDPWEEDTRVVPAYDVHRPHAAGGAVPGPVPMPGRHASRRAPSAGERTAVVTDLVPDTLRGRIGLGAAHLTVVALLVAVGALVVAWVVVRGDPQAPTAVAVEQSAASTPPLAGGLDPSATGEDEAVPVGSAGESVPVGTTGAAHADGDGSTVTVDVAGKVRRPGIVVLDAGARVVDALEGAGGAKPGVDLVGLNLARLLVDGEQIVVGGPPGAVPAPVTGSATGSEGTTATGTPGTTATPGALVDLNLATQPELEELPEVGPVTAAAIIAWREENGGFTAVTELLEVDGIGDKTLEQLTPLVTV